MKMYLFRKPEGAYTIPFREVALQHNVTSSKLFAGLLAIVCLVLCILDRFTASSRVLKYPSEYAAAITFICCSSCICYIAFVISKKLNDRYSAGAYRFLTIFYPVVVIFSSLWITFVMQHNPSNTMSIFVLGILSVSALWVFEEVPAVILSLFMLLLFDGGLHYFQTDPCKLFTNYITGTVVSVLFLFFSRVKFSINFNHFMQLKKLEQNRQDIIRIHEMQTNTLAVVAHDLHAPLNNLMALAGLIKESDSPQEREEFCELIIDTCRKSNGTIDDLLTEARNEHGACKFNRTCMNDLVNETLKKIIKCRHFGQQIIYELPNEKVYATVDNNKITRVLENLVTNAIKFTNDNGVIAVKMNRDSEHLHILVSDNGIGIPEHLLPHLFQTFSKAGRTGVHGEASYGLGLSICQLIVKQHNGDICAHSEVGKGTQMEITLPIAC